MEIDSKSVLVCGVGYLGGYLAEKLRQGGWNVIAASKHGDEGVHQVDLGSRTEVDRFGEELKTRPRYVVHCASSNRGGPDAYRSVFVRGIEHLTSSFVGSHIILTSSTSVYPQIDGSVVTENSPANPERQTGQYLRQAEDRLLKCGGTVLRLAGIYGPGRSVHLQRMVEGTATIESGEVSRWLNQIHRDDAAAAIEQFLDNPLSGIFNVADDEPVTQRDCYRKLAELLDREVPGEQPANPDRKRAWTNKKVSNARLRSVGWQPQFPSFLGAVVEDKRLLPSVSETE